MLPIKHLLIPFDFSGRATAMVEYALPLAERYGAKATILHVLQIPPAVPASPFPEAYRLLGVTEDLLLKHEERFRNHEFPFPVPSSVERVIIRGEAADGILDWSRRNEADLIAMPTRGHGVLRRFLLGSVSAKVLDGAAVPVLTGAHLQDAPVKANITKVLCAVDLADHSSKTLRFAAGFASDMGAELHVMHSVEVEDMKNALNFGSEWEHKAVEHARASVHALQADLQMACDVHVEVGEPAKTIPRLAESLDASLLVVGRSVKGKIGGFLRTNAYALIRESPCPVLSI